MNFTKKDDCLKIIDHSVIKSPNDKNEYYYDMLPNGLRYIVISNKDIDKSAVGMDVYIGSADDPKEYQGLAHCLEHMIFLGTEKYPKPSGFDDFLNKNSGYSNANTSLDHTNYHFEICNDKLEEGIDMFSEFFSKPLFANELLNKELNAIQSEFISDYRDDLNRLYHLILIEGYKDSPFNTFINGNLETLQKPEIRDKAIEFFKKYYDPKILSLCVFSNKTIEELKNLVIKYFSKIQNIQNFQKIQKKILYDENNMGYYYKIIPVKDISCIYFFWVINKSYNQYYKSDPLNYVISVLGHEGKHSLTSYLKKKSYITSLTASYDNIYDIFTKIYIDIKLTDEGYSNINEVIKIVLSYVKYLQEEELHKDFFEEIKRTTEINFYLDEQNDPIELCEDLSSSITITYLDEEMFVKSKITEYRPDLIKEILNSLTLHNLNIYEISSKLKDKKDNKQIYNIEEIYKTEYTKEKIDFSSFIFDIKSNKDLDLSYPDLNPYLPNDLNMINLSLDNININDYLIPKKVYDNERTIWYKPNIKYNMPKVYISCKAYISNINLDYTTLLVYTEIFFKIINQELSELIYLGDSSDHSVNISLTVSSMIIKIEGYTDSIGNYINEYFKQFSKLIDITKIEGINNKILTFLEKMIQKYNNSLIGDVREQTELRLNKILREVYTKNKLEIMQKIKDELLKNDMIPNKFLFFFKNIFKKMKFEWFVEGNIFLKDAKKIIKKVESELNKWSINGENENKKNKEFLSINEIRKQRIVHLPDNKIYRYNFSSKDKENESSTILIYFQIDNFNYNNNNIFNNNVYNEYIKNRSCLYIIHSIFYELFYDELRTDQQVGYDVDFVENNEWYILGLYFFVSSSKYNPDEIVEKINNFIIDNDINDPENFTDEDYESYKKSVINDLSQKPLTLEEEYTRDFSFISKRIYIFSLRQDMINYIKNNINKQMIIDFFNKYIYKKAKRLEIALYCSKKKEEKKEEKMEIEEKDEEKEEDEKEEDENDDNNDDNNDDILPSYKDIKIEIINDIDDFHRNINYYDNEFY